MRPFQKGTSALSYSEEPPQVINGRLDLTKWNFTENGVVKLHGDWEFYWKELLTAFNLLSIKFQNNTFQAD